MRKLKLQMQLSVDGFCAGPNGEMDWMTWDWDQQLKKYVSDLHENVDHIILGRKLAEGFIPTWKSRLEEPAGEETSFIKKMNETPKTVFTKTLKESIWDKTELATGRLAEEISKLRNQAGGDIIVYGGAHFVSDLIANGLIDEYHFFVNPVILGDGLAIFNKVNPYQHLSLIQAQAFNCGVTVLNFKPKE